MKRREFITLALGATYPMGAVAQGGLPVVGHLASGSNEITAHRIATFRKALAEGGYVDGKTIEIDARLASQATALIARVPALIAASGILAAREAQASTKTIPIVFIIGGDPVAMGLVASLNRPGSNTTGVSILTTQSEAKRLELISEIVPNAQTIAILINPANATTEPKIRELNAAAKTLRRQLHFFKASNEAEVDLAFSVIAERRIGPVVIAADNFYTSQGPRFAGLAIRHAMAGICPYRDFATSGGLASFGPNLDEEDRLIGQYAARILKGDKPSDLPVIQSSKVSLIINLKAAKALGVEVPQAVLARADEVIE
jgi:putative ABC transport system substrate-binding protein